MNGTRVLKHGLLAMIAALCVAPSAWANGTAAVAGTELLVTGTGTDNIQVWLPGSALEPPCAGPANCPATGAYPGGAPPTPYIVREMGGGTITAGTGCTQVATNEAHCSRGGAAWGAFTVKINGGTGNDTLHLEAPLIVSGEGNTGDTYWINGEDGNDTIIGGENNDFISGGAGNDVIDGFAGNDIITGADFAPLRGAVDAAGLPQGIDFANGAFTGLLAGTASGTDRIFGGAGGDTITDGDSDAGANTPNADRISGFSCSGTGASAGGACPPQAVDGVLNVDVPENDVDELYWGHRTKAVVVNLGVATAQGGCAAVTCTTPNEGEIIIGFRGVYSGDGNDTLTGHAPSSATVGNTFYGGAGNDKLDGLDGNDELIGGAGQDNLLGGDGADFLNPGGVITSAAGQPTIMTSDGQDTVDGGASGTDTTGDGSTVTSVNDLITYSGRSDDLTLNLNNANGWGAAGENDLVSNVEDVTGGHGADTITLKAGQSSIVESDPVAPEVPHAGEPVLPSPPPGGYYANDTIHARNAATDTVYCGGIAPDVDADTVFADRTPADVTQPDCEVVDLPPIPQPACNDGVDNDGDGKVDLADIGCVNAQDNDESNVAGAAPPACADGRDNDGDGKIDFPADPGCAGAGDTTETDPVTDPGTGNTATNRVRISGPSTIKGTVKVKKNGTFTLSKIKITCPSGNRNCSVRTTVAVTARKAANYTLRAGRTAAARGKLGKKQLSQLKKRKRLKATVTIRVVRNGVATTKKVKVTFRR